MIARPPSEAGLRWLCALLLLGVTAAVFAPSLGCGFADWDDPINLVDNERYRGFGSDNLRWMFGATHAGHYHPLTWISFAFDHALWGMDPWGYHLTNVALHALGVALVALLFARLPWLAAAGRRGVLAACAAALLWGLHPLRVESVTWITERRDVLSLVFALLAVHAYLTAAARGRGWAGWLVFASAATAASLLSKAWLITMPAVLLLLDIEPLRRVRLHRWRPSAAAGTWWEKVPFVLLSAAFAWMALRAQAESQALDTSARYGLVSRFLQACWGACFYLWKTVWPTGLAPLYERPPQVGLGDPRFLVGLVGVAAMVAGAWWLRRRRPAVVVALAIYLVVAAPVLGFAQSGPQLVADRYAHVSTLPWFALVAAWLVGGRWRIACGVVALAVLVPGTVRQQGYWRDPEVFWARAVTANPAGSIATYNLALQLHRRCEDARQASQPVDRAVLARAETLYRTSLTADPDGIEALNNLGGLLAGDDRVAEALELWRRSLSLQPNHRDAARIRELVDLFARR